MSKHNGETLYYYNSSSNMASEKMTTIADPAFRAIPKNSTYFMIWRVENLQLAAVPKDQYGSFFSDDSYLVLCITEYGDASGGAHMVPKETRKGLEYHIHFWLGQGTSNDEAGVAAYKAVELDDYFGGTAIQHREAQGNESKRFVAYFKNGIKLLNGGAASGFHHVTDEIHQRMFQVKGKRTPVIKEMPSIAWEHMNNGDVFVLDLQHAIFVWVGKHANRGEKLKAAKVAQNLKDDRDRPIIIVEDGEEGQLGNTEKQYFGQFLPLTAKEIKNYQDVAADEAAEQKRVELKLYRCSDEDGTLKVTEVKGGPLFQEDLNSQDSYIIDNGESGIWVWVGKKASQKERVEAMRNAQGFSKKKGYSQLTPVTRVIDNGEPQEFKSLFRSWKERNQTVGIGQTHTRGKIAKVVQTKFDVNTLHENTRLAAEVRMVDDGSGDKEVFRADEFDLVPVDPQYYGKFYTGDCYVIVYKYSMGGSENYIIYYWLGAKSTADEQGTAALKTVGLDNKYGGKAVQIRINEGKEPPHFFAIFGGKISTYFGGHGSSFKNANEADTGHSTTNYLLQVRGTTHNHIRAMEVEKRAASLNSNDVFVLFTPSITYIWAGKGSTGDEREMARQIANLTSKDPTLISEGQEKNDFWEAIGGQEPYSADKRLQEEDKDHQARLFHCSNATGSFKVDEIVDFNQSDLMEEDVMLLDAWDHIFVWIGDESRPDEKQMAEQMAIEYLNTDPSKRDVNTPIVRVKQGFEPPTFIGFFGAWDRSLWSNNKTYEQMKAELKQNYPGLTLVISTQNGFKDDFPRYPLADLLHKDVERLPEGVNPTCKELYLKDDEFEELFKMNRESFTSMPQWKQQSLKKQAGLF